MYILSSRISIEIYSEPLMHALSPSKGPFAGIFLFHLKLSQRTVHMYLTKNVYILYYHKNSSMIRLNSHKIVYKSIGLIH